MKCYQHTSKNIITTSGSVRSKAVNCGSQAPVGTSWHSSLEPQNGSHGVSMRRSGAQTSEALCFGLREQKEPGCWLTERRVAGDEFEGSITQLRMNS